MIVDYHMHLRDRPGAESGGRYLVDRLELHVEQARRAGVDEIGISDHGYHFRQGEAIWDVPWMQDRWGDDLDEYVAAVEEGKRRGLPVKLGLEVDFLPEHVDELAALLAPYPWDYLLGSVHFVDGQSVDMDPAFADEAGWRAYFAALAKAAGSGLFDVLSHPDLVKFFGRRPDPRVVEELHEDAAEAIAAAGVCVEVSAAGLHKPVGELYPDASLLRRCRELSVPITLASDAHVPEHVGRDVDRAADHARAAGYDTVTIFDLRRRRQEPLG
ncbi:MAG TPA: histidinol-phosphatase HisJ family protein [Gaiellaceae bacterium]